MANEHAHTMVVSGAGAVEIVPDMAYVDASIEVTDATPSVAYAEVGSVARRVVAAMGERGVGEADRQTRAVSLRPQYVHDGTSTSITGYTAVHALRLRIVRLAMLSEVLDVLVEVAGDALRLDGFTLGGRDPGAAQARAEAAAVADARQRAQRLAAAAGVELGPVLALRQEPDGQPHQSVGLAWTSESAGTPVQAGADTVRARVTVTFSLGG